VVNALHGVSSGAILVSSLALLADYVPVKHRGREIGMFDGVNLAGWGAGFLVGGLLKDYFASNLYMVFVVGGALALFGFIYAYLNLSEPKKKTFLVEELRPDHIFSVLKQRSIILLVLPWLVIYMLIGNIFAFLPKAGSQEFELAGWVIGGAMFAGCVAIMLFQRGYGALSDKIGRVRVMSIGIAGMLLLFLLAGMAYSIVPNIEGDDVTDEIVFDQESDFLAPQVLMGNITFTGGALVVNGTSPAIHYSGPYSFEDLPVHRIRATWTGGGSLAAFFGKDNSSIDLENSEWVRLPGNTRKIWIQASLDNGTQSVSDLAIEFQHAAPAPDIIGAVLGNKMLLAGFGISVIMAGAFAPAALASLADEAHSKKRGVTMGLYSVVISLGQVIGPISTGWIMDRYGGMGFLYFLGAIGVFLGVVLILRWMDTRGFWDDKDKKKKPPRTREEE
jgi:MFS family permease